MSENPQPSLVDIESEAITIRQEMAALQILDQPSYDYAVLKRTEAVQWLNTEDSYVEILQWAGQTNVQMGQGSKLAINTLEGVMTAAKGDWIIRGVKGEFYPCKPDIFAATYERA